jgi:hypothetical protein
MQSKINVNRFLTFLLVIIGSHASWLAVSDVTLVLFFFIASYFYIIRGFNLHYEVIIFLVGYFLLLIWYFFDFGWFNFTSSFRLLIKLFLGYIIVKQVGLTLIFHFEEIVYKLVLISMGFWIIQLIDFDAVFYMVGLFEKIFPFLDYRGDKFANIWVFTVNNSANYEHWYRNSGFAWEPKGFANYIFIALVFNFLKQKKSNLKNRRGLVYFLAMLSTFSTTGYILLFVYAVFVITNLYSITSRALSMSAVMIFSISLFFGSPLLYEKIKNEIDMTAKLTSYVEMQGDSEERKSLGRFGSLAVDFNDFMKRPLFGVGMQEEERTQGLFVQIVRVNGFSDLLSRFGLFGVIFVFLSYYISFRYVAVACQSRGGAILTAGFFILSFGSAIILNPLFFAFQFLFVTKKANYV